MDAWERRRMKVGHGRMETERIAGRGPLETGVGYSCHGWILDGW